MKTIISNQSTLFIYLFKLIWTYSKIISWELYAIDFSFPLCSSLSPWGVRLQWLTENKLKILLVENFFFAFLLFKCETYGGIWVFSRWTNFKMRNNYCFTKSWSKIISLLVGLINCTHETVWKWVWKRESSIKQDMSTMSLKDSRK